MKTLTNYLTLALVLFVAAFFTACSPDYNNVDTKLPSLTTYDATSVSKTGAVCGGEVTADGGFAVTDRGVCWSTSKKPTMDDNYISEGSGLGSFTVQITGLALNTTYYVRTYAENENGVAYGPEKSFKTLDKIDEFLYYKADHRDCWGLIDGGTFEWAVRFPYEMVGPYSGAAVSCVRFYNYFSGTTYTAKVYKGGVTEPVDLMATQSKYITSVGWNSICFDDHYCLDGINSLWVSITVEHPSGSYRAGSAYGIDNKDTRWYNPNNYGWLDMKEHNSSNDDVNWEIWVYVTDESKENGSHLIELPQYVPNNNTNLKSIEGVRNSE